MSLEHWVIDPSHSRLGFHVRHLMITNVRGQFEKWQGDLQFDPDDPTRARVVLTIDAASIDTREAQRDAHLRSAEFFDVDRFPMIRFEATQIERRTLDDYVVTGDLTMRGITRRVVLDASRSQPIVDRDGRVRVGFQIAGALSRKDFGLTWNFVLETGGVVVGDRVVLEIELQAILSEERQVLGRSSSSD
jgi:polyisoprenoid-binding protein YceI